MKKVLLAVLLLSSAGAYAQDLEFGVGGGFSTNTAPDGNMPYKQDQSLTNYAGTLKLVYTTRNFWQFGLDGHVMEIAGRSTKSYPGPFAGDTVGGDNRKIVYAKFGVSVCGVANKAFHSFNKETHQYGKSYLYAGVALGYGAARNDHIEYTSGESYNGPDGGRGIVFGGQAGYVANLSEKLGFNIEVALRRLDFKYDAGVPLLTPHQYLHYNVMVFPITVGLRYFIFRTDRTLVPRYDVVRPLGRSSY